MNRIDTRTCRRCGWTHKGSEDMCSICERYVEIKELKNSQKEKIKEEYGALIFSIKDRIELGKVGKKSYRDIYKNVHEDIKKLYILDIKGRLRYEDDLIARQIWGIEAWHLFVTKNVRKIFENE